MGTFISLLLIAGIWSLAYVGASLTVWTLALAAALLILQFTGAIVWSGLILWPIFLAVFVPLNLTQIRKTYITQKAFSLVRQVLPPMSDTEKEAIEAGDVWWEAKLFQGRPEWNQWIETQCPKMTSQEVSFLNNQVEHLVDLINDWQVLQEEYDLAPEVWQYLKDERFFGMCIPKQYGGLEFSALAHSEIISRIATKSISAAVTTMVPNSLGPGELLIKYGTEKQKEHYLPRLALGQEIPCFGLTSTSAGSDAGSIRDYGIVCRGNYNGKEVLGIRLNWEKRYITLAPVATVIGIAFKLYDPDTLLGEATEYGITLCLIPTDHPGVRIGRRHFPLQMAFMNGPTEGKDVFVPIDWIIGGREMAGQGWRMLMECLSAGRGISLPALATASSAISYRMSGAYSRLREQFNMPIGKFEGIQEALANIGGYNYIIEATRQITACSIDLGQKPAVVSAIAKYHLTELARKSVNHAMDIHGGKAIIMGPSNTLASLYQAQPISITVEGANILTRSLMIFGQGAIRCHPFVRDEIAAAQNYETNPELSLDKFDKAFWSHAGYFISNLSRSLFLGLTGAWLLIPARKDMFYRQFQKLTWMSSALALTSDVSMMTLGGRLKIAEQLSARLGDVLSHLYLATCVLKYYYNCGEKESDRQHVEWAVNHCLHQCQEAFYGFLNNFPNRPVAWMMRLFCFPWGAHCNAPKDTLSRAVARQMMEDSEFRERVSRTMHVSSHKETGVETVEKAFKQLIELQPIFNKLSEAVANKKIHKKLSLKEKLDIAVDKQIIQPNERDQITNFEKLRANVIAVDDFAPEYFETREKSWQTKQKQQVGTFTS